MSTTHYRKKFAVFPGRRVSNKNAQGTTRAILAVGHAL